MTSHDESPASFPLDINQELGTGGQTAEPKLGPEDHDAAQVILALPTPPLSMQENDESELVRPGSEIEAAGSAKRTRHDSTDEMEGLDIDIPIDPQLMMGDGTSSDPWLPVDRAADTAEDEFVFVEDEDDEDEDLEEIGPQDLQPEDEDFCVVDDNDDDSEVEW